MRVRVGGCAAGRLQVQILEWGVGRKGRGGGWRGSLVVMIRGGRLAKWIVSSGGGGEMGLS